jgi:protein-tyrosine phosphatase
MIAVVEAPFRILYVCIGNVCRSAFAERLTRREIERRPAFRPRRVQVSSAGTRARTGELMHPYTARLLWTWSADPAGFVSRRLTPALLRDTDLVLTATGQERDDVVGLLPATLRRAFTVNEFARLATRVDEPPGRRGDDAADRARRVVAAALALRGRVPVDAPLPDGSPVPDDIADPAHTLDAFNECGSAIDRAVRTVVHALFEPLVAGATQPRGARCQSTGTHRLSATRKPHRHADTGGPPA